MANISAAIEALCTVSEQDIEQYRSDEPQKVEQAAQILQRLASQVRAPDESQRQLDKQQMSNRVAFKTQQGWGGRLRPGRTCNTNWAGAEISVRLEKEPWGHESRTDGYLEYGATTENGAATENGLGTEHEATTNNHVATENGVGTKNQATSIHHVGTENQAISNNHGATDNEAATNNHEATKNQVATNDEVAMMAKKKKKKKKKQVTMKLDRRYTELKNFLSQSPKDAVGCLPEEQQDSRVKDIDERNGEQKTLQVQFRRVLAERSLALDFDCWNPKKLEWMIENKSFDPPKGRFYSIRAFARHHFGNPPDAVRKGIVEGLKILTIERGCSSHLPGIPGILAFVHEDFRKSFSEAAKVLDSPLSSEITELATIKRAWMIEAQEHYDSQCPRRYQMREKPGFLSGKQTAKGTCGCSMFRISLTLFRCRNRSGLCCGEYLFGFTAKHIHSSYPYCGNHFSISAR
jgi:hypothetical protein